MSPVKRSLRNVARRTLTGILLPLAFLLAIAGAISLEDNVKPTQDIGYPAAPATVKTSSPAERLNARVIRMYEENDCWNADSPSPLEPGEYPRHVLISFPGSAVPQLGGPIRVGQALGQIFEGEDHGFTVHAFCR